MKFTPHFMNLTVEIIPNYSIYSIALHAFLASIPLLQWFTQALPLLPHRCPQKPGIFHSNYSRLSHSQLLHRVPRSTTSRFHLTFPTMVATNSTMLPLGVKAPAFTLPDTSGKEVSLTDFTQAAALVIVFMCNHCPYVKHLRSALAQFAREYQPLGVAVVGINSNDVQNYPADSPAKMAEEVKSAGYTFPYLYDESQAAAKAYRAACTPDFYVFDREQRLVYRGQFDDSRPSNGIPPTGRDLRAALDAVLAGKPVSAAQKPSLGCNIKWKPGNEPEYFG